MIDRTRISEPFDRNTATVFEYEAMVDEINLLRKEVDQLKEQLAKDGKA
jgi:hypothetical protein